MHGRSSLTRAVYLGALLAAACTGSPEVDGSALITFSGAASVGPVITDATVQAFELSPHFAREALLGTDETDETGAFSLEFVRSDQAGLVCVSGGISIDPSTGTNIQLDEFELCNIVLDLDNAPSPIPITAWTHLATTRAAALLKFEGVPFEEAWAQARREIDSLCACANPGFDVVAALPTDPTVAPETGEQLSAPMLSGILHAGLSQLALIESELLGLTGGIRINAFTLVDLVAQDIAADGLANGHAWDESLFALGYKLTPDTLRAELAHGVEAFLDSDRNATSITSADAVDLLACLSEHDSPLFSSRPGTDFDFTRPTVSFAAPTDGSFVRGRFAVDVLATDERGIKAVRFTVGAELVEEVTLEGPETPTARLSGWINSATLEEGELTLEVEAEDLEGNTARAELVVTVRNQAPTVTIGSPANTSMLSGIVALTITASETATGITPYLNGLPSRAIGRDQNEDPLQFVATLDTQHPEMGTGLHIIRAVAADAAGNIATTEHQVSVDNEGPELGLDLPEMVNSSSVVLQVTSRDPDSVIATGQVYVNDVAETPIDYPAENWSLAIEIPCDAESTVRVVVTNEAGVSTSRQASIACDDSAPEFELLPSSYWPADTLEVQWLPEDGMLQYNPGTEVALETTDWSNSGEPPLLIKFFNRLDYLLTEGWGIVTNNLPTLSFAFNDQPNGSVDIRTEPSELYVRYRYKVDGNTQRGWTPLAVSEDGTAELPFSYQTLGPALADRGGVARHKIELEIHDLAGNVTLTDFYFRMRAISPPAYLTNCGVGELDGKSLEANSLHSWFLAWQPSFFNGELQFAHLPRGTLAPWRYEFTLADVEAHIKETDRYWALYELSEQLCCVTHTADDDYPSGQGCAPVCDSGGWRHIFQVDGWADTCHSGVPVQHSVVRPCQLGTGSYPSTPFVEDSGSFDWATGRWSVELWRQQGYEAVPLVARTQTQPNAGFNMPDYPGSSFGWMEEWSGAFSFYSVLEHPDAHQLEYRCDYLPRTWKYQGIRLVEYIAAMQFEIPIPGITVFLDVDDDPVELRHDASCESGDLNFDMIER